MAISHNNFCFCFKITKSIFIILTDDQNMYLLITCIKDIIKAKTSDYFVRSKYWLQLNLILVLVCSFLQRKRAYYFLILDDYIMVLILQLLTIVDFKSETFIHLIFCQVSKPIVIDYKLRLL